MGGKVPRYAELWLPRFLKDFNYNRGSRVPHIGVLNLVTELFSTISMVQMLVVTELFPKLSIVQMLVVTELFSKISMLQIRAHFPNYSFFASEAMCVGKLGLGFSNAQEFVAVRCDIFRIFKISTFSKGHSEATVILT